MEIDKENLKNETKETVNQVKDTLKNVDINKEAKETKGFIKEMFVSPFEKIEKIANGEEEAFKRSVILLAIQVILATVVSILEYHYGNIFSKLWDIVVDAATPIISIVIPAAIILIINKNNKKPLTTIVSTLVITEIPTIIATAIDVLEKLLRNIYLVTSPISSALYALTIIFTFFGIKTLLGEEKESALYKYAIIKVITSLVLCII